MATDINAGVQRTMDHVLEEIQKVQQQNLQELVPLKEKIAKNIGKLFSLATKNILMNENIRQEIDINSDEFKNLLESIKKFGLLQSLVVEYRESEVNPNGYELICVAGHRRLTAAKILNIEKVPCLIHQYNDLSDRTGIALSENLNREGLYCLDIADGYAELSKLGWTEEKISLHFERDIRTIQRYLTAASWPDDIKLLIRANKDKFPASIVMKKFSLRSYKSIDAIVLLRREVNDIINPNSEPELNSKKKTVEVKLENYFKENENKLTEENKKMITDALIFLGYLKVQKSS